MSILPTRIHRSKAIPTKTQQDTEMVSKCLQQREKGNPGTCHATLETYCRDTLSRQSGTDRGTHRENSRTVRCANSQTLPQARSEIFFPVCRNLWPRARQASALPLSHTLVLTKMQRSPKERQRLLQALGSLQAKGNGKF